MRDGTPKPKGAEEARHRHYPRGARRLRLPPNVRPLRTARLLLRGGEVDLTLARSGAGAWIIFARPLGRVRCHECVGLPLLMVRHTYTRADAERRFLRMVDALAGDDVIEFLTRCKPHERIDAYFLGLLGHDSLDSALGEKLVRAAGAALHALRQKGAISESEFACGQASIALRTMAPPRFL